MQSPLHVLVLPRPNTKLFIYIFHKLIGDRQRKNTLRWKSIVP